MPSCPHVPEGFDVLVELPTPALEKALHHPERISVDGATLAALGASPGMQVLLRSSPRDAALCTVVEEEPRGGCHGVVRMGSACRERLGVTGAFAARLERRGPHATVSDLEAPQSSEFIERCADDGKQDFLAALAPHGGMIEKFTAEQAAHAGKLRAGRCTVWRCLGWSVGGGASRRWHITSTDISDRSFPLLASISGRRFRHAIAFHGYSSPRILVGGGAPKPVRESVRAAIEKALRGTGIGVDLGGEGRLYSGASPRNVVNRLSRDGGVQIEQPKEARERFWKEIAEAAVSALALP